MDDNSINQNTTNRSCGTEYFPEMEKYLKNRTETGKRCMSHKYILIVISLLVVFVMLLQPGAAHAADGGTIAADSGIQERLIEKYGLDDSKPSSQPGWGGADIGISDPLSLILSIFRVIVNPYAWVVPEFIHYLFDQ